MNSDWATHCISIHAPREGGDTHSIAYLYECLISIHAPPRGATSIVLAPIALPDISIHAPREGGDAAAGHKTTATS